MSRPLAWGRALEWIRRVEGAFVDNPSDPGGPTYAGVSLRAVQGLDADKDGRLDFDVDGDGDVDRADIIALREANNFGRVAELYIDQYWAPVHGAELPAALGLFAFDSAVHHGVRPAILLLQLGIGAEPDGIIGPRTIARAQASANDPHALEYCLSERADLMRRICIGRPASAKFFVGWMRRLFMLEHEARP